MRGLFYSIDTSELAINQERAGAAVTEQHGKEIVTCGG